VVDPAPSTSIETGVAAKALADLGDRLTDNYPFHHPRYAGQMLKPPHPIAVAAYAATMLINPNNHALDGGPATAALEREVVADLARMFGLPDHLGHLTSSGTIANLEALFVARELHPDKAIAYASNAHYTHGRMCGVLRVEGVAIASDATGHVDLDALRDALATGTVGTVVTTAGTTGLEAIDPIHEVIAIAREFGVRVHVDAAYGGFFTLLAGEDHDDRAALDPLPWNAIALADSIVVDPHKHGLQPYGCGAVLFADPSVGRFYVHDSPYTYFTSDELHLGEISLECSRAGAAAAALWTTLQVLPLHRSGLGEVLAAGRRAALDWHDLLSESSVVAAYTAPELDIVTYLPALGSTGEIDRISRAIMSAGMVDADPIFLSTLRIASADLVDRRREITKDTDDTTILRSVLMKPEHEAHVPWLNDRVETLARELTRK